MSTPIKVCTFNILTHHGRYPDRFFKRMPNIYAAIKAEQADFIGFQEVQPEAQDWLKSAFPEYGIVGCGRDADLRGESTPILYNKERFDICWLDMVWLSPTPSIPGSRFEEQSMCPRICVAARFYDRVDRRLIAVYNTHLDHEGEKARQLGMRQILAKIEKDCDLFDIPVIMTGDFNAEPDSVAITETLAFERHPLCDVTKDLAYSFHNFGQCKNKIDYIFADKGVKATDVRLWNNYDTEAAFISDHYPVSAVLEF